MEAYGVYRKPCGSVTIGGQGKEVYIPAGSGELSCQEIWEAALGNEITPGVAILYDAGTCEPLPAPGVDGQS